MQRANPLTIMSKNREQSSPVVVLSVSVIADGKFFAAGSETPLSETTLPEHLRQYIATGEETLYTPAHRDYYREGPPAEYAREPLPPETEEALQAIHAKSTSMVKAQMQFDQTAADNAYEGAKQAVEAKVAQFFVKRGGQWAHVQRAKLKLGELVFVKRPNGEMETVGCVDSRGEPPEQEIVL